MTDLNKTKVLEELGIGNRKKQFINRVLTYVLDENMSTLDSIMEVCKELELDPEEVAPLITGPLLEKVRLDAINRNILRKCRKPVRNSFIDDCV